MIEISIQSDIKKALSKLEKFDTRQVPFVIAKALTNTAQDVKKDLREVMPRVFDRPTPYTLNSLYVKTANKKTLEAQVYLKTDSFKGTPASKYLRPQIFGGDRNIKRVERLLTGRGILPSGMSFVPGEGAELDQYGNMRRGQISKILAQMKANTDFYQNETKASRKRKGKKNGPRYFAGSPGNGNLPQGIWARYSFSGGTAIKPIMIFVNVPRYRARYDFAGVGRKTISKRFGFHLDAAMRFALATSR